MKLRKSSGLIMNLRMDEGSGTVAGDSSRYGNDGALNGCKWVERGLEFNGSSDYIDCGNDDSLDITDTITISAWINLTAIGAYQGIFSRYIGWRSDGYYIVITSGNKIRFQTLAAGDDCDGGTSLEKDTWYHIAAVQNGIVTKKIYINGLEDGNLNNPNAIVSTPGTNAYIGVDGSPPGQEFNGSIDQVRIHNRSLSAREIMKYYEATKYNYG